MCGRINATLTPWFSTEQENECINKCLKNAFDVREVCLGCLCI